MHYHGQILAMNECGYRQMYDVKYLLHQDMDEFVVPTTAEDWSSMIDDISAEWSAIQTDRIASYSFRNRFFPLGFTDVLDKVLALIGGDSRIQPGQHVLSHNLCRTNTQRKVLPHTWNTIEYKSS